MPGPKQDASKINTLVSGSAVARVLVHSRDIVVSYLGVWVLLDLLNTVEWVVDLYTSLHSSGLTPFATTTVCATFEL